MNIIFLTKYGNLAASSRLRAYQYQDKIESSKIKVDVQPLLSNSYIEKKFNNKPVGLFHIFYLFIKRLFFLFRLGKYDVIVIHIELFPFIPPIFEWVLFRTKKKIYFDFDDAVFHNYDLSENFYIKFFLSKKIKYLMRMSTGVIAGNKYIQNYAHNAGSKNILILPTVINIDKYPKKPKKYISNESFTIGWIGSSSTTKYLDIIKAPLSKLGQLVPVTLYLMGADKEYNISVDNIKIISVSWSETKEQEALNEFDVGVMPLYDSPWEKGKCAFKLIQYMASSLPVVASNVGMNGDIIDNSGNGFLATTSDDWVASLNKLYLDPKLRKEMGENGRKLVEKDFTIQGKLIDFEMFLNRQVY